LIHGFNSPLALIAELLSRVSPPEMSIASSPGDLGGIGEGAAY
jgi:hypothetical protein